MSPVSIYKTDVLFKFLKTAYDDRNIYQLVSNKIYKRFENNEMVTCQIETTASGWSNIYLCEMKLNKKMIRNSDLKYYIGDYE
jgi:hypothetical protein